MTLETLAPLAAQAAAMLRERGQTIAVADGATGGLISAGLLTVPDATDFCRGGGVIYSLRGRAILLDLGRKQLAGMESVTEPYALLQARAIRDRFGADWGIAETGSAGPATHPRGAPTGRSCIAVTGPGIAIARTIDRRQRSYPQYERLRHGRAGTAGRCARRSGAVGRTLRAAYSSGSFHGPLPPSAMKRSVRVVITGSGTGPSDRIMSWKARMSNLAPSAVCARARSFSIWSWPR